MSVEHFNSEQIPLDITVLHAVVRPMKNSPPPLWIGRIGASWPGPAAAISTPEVHRVLKYEAPPMESVEENPNVVEEKQKSVEEIKADRRYSPHQVEDLRRMRANQRAMKKFKLSRGINKWLASLKKRKEKNRVKLEIPFVPWWKYK
eukprot:CAMPEP_0182451338 /NCGR_PEP_ID=MMETSP1172-20130603/43668_1 /TAXON_ID=708627 /ORGANISM="Timspurckia oligopyrenoides, Strain CCMP3278" /LENGTH=146 /DNA_ID=CAMNT_0024649107 /DNA_START=1972 /DNA_END=2412 /DNA_ORIENTATION=-